MVFHAPRNSSERHILDGNAYTGDHLFIRVLLQILQWGFFTLKVSKHLRNEGLSKTLMGKKTFWAKFHN